MRELFLYICDYSLQGRHEELREQRIGEVVFGRGNDFRPNDDTIVRVEVRKLRQRLQEYFETEGNDDPILISIPKGAYIASFEPRTPQVAPSELDDGAGSRAPGPPATAIRDREQGAGPSFVWAVILAITTVLFGSIAAWYAVRDSQEARPTARESASPVRKNPLWAALFNKDQQTYVVCADSALAMYQDITGVPMSFSDYVNRNYGASARGASGVAGDLLRVLPQRKYTHISDVRLVQAFQQLTYEYGGRTTVRHARDMQLIDFKSGNFILIGSRHATPWVELFEGSLNFHFEFNFKTQCPGFRNVHPQPGEKSIYWREGNSAQGGETYSVISFVPNSAHNGSVLMIAGTTGEGTEAAGDYATHPELLDKLLESIHAVDHGRARYFEVLLKSGMLGGTSERSEMVAYRMLPENK